MKNKKPRIVFMGTPSFAVPSLEAIVDKGYDVAAVVTRPDAPKGRGLSMAKSPVKLKAEELGLSVIDAANMKDSAFIAALKSLNPDVFAVVAFRILPPELLSIPPLGSYNIHPSLLPKYRGAAPIQWALANGERETGVTIFRLNSVIDGGEIVAQEKFPVEKSDTASLLTNRLAVEGARMLCSVIDCIVNGEVRTFVQNDTLATPAPKLKKEDGLIDFSMSAEEMHNRLRGFDPFPGIYTIHGGKRVVVLSASVLDVAGSPGIVSNISSDGITVGTGKGSLLLSVVKPEGRAAMSAKDYANGNKIIKGAAFGR
jgi:methionyl-tRNA formyltransferase